MREDGLREVYVAEDCGEQASGERLRLVEGPPSTPALAEYLDRLGVALEPGWRVEINLRASTGSATPRGACARLHHPHRLRPRGARAVFADASPRHAHHLRAPSRARARIAGAPAWLQDPGEQDITAHVDFTSVRAAAEAKG
jgi:hypothetical protein